MHDLKINETITSEEKLKKLESLIADELDKHCYKDENGEFYSEIYVDYRDEISDDTIKEILSAENPQEAYNDTIYDMYNDAAGYDRHEITNKVEDAIEANEEALAIIEELDIDLYEMISDSFYMKYPYDHFMNTEVCINIVLDTGDMNYDFTKNNLANYYAEMYQEDSVLPEYSSLVWLAKEQGIEEKEIIHALSEGETFTKEHKKILDRMDALNNTLYDLGKDKYNSEYDCGAFSRYKKVKPELDELDRRILKTEKQLEQNKNIIYEEYKETFLDPKGFSMTEKEFQARQQIVVGDIQAKLLSLKNEKIHLMDMKFLMEPKVYRVKLAVDELESIQKNEYKEMSATDEFKRARFLEEMLSESRNTGSHMNALTFCVKMPLEMAINTAEIIKKEEPYNNSYTPEERTGNSFLTISKDAACGLYDSWNGAGSLFELELIKDVELPLKYIHDFNVDGNLGYSIAGIYGTDQSFWKGTVKEVVEIEPGLNKDKEHEKETSKSHLSLDEQLKNANEKLSKHSLSNDRNELEDRER